SLICLFGSLLVTMTYYDIPVSEYFPIMGLAGVLAYTYYLYKIGARTLGLSTLMLIPITYLMGVFVGFGFYLQAVASVFILLFILISGKTLHEKIEHLKGSEINEMIEFGLILFVVYPLLPKEPIVFNGFMIDLVMLFLFIILVSLINFMAFLASRIFKKATVGMLGFASGVINSTVAISFFAKRDGRASSTGARAALLGSLVRNLVLLGAVIPQDFITLLPFFALIIAIPTIMIFMERKQAKSKISVEQPFSILSGIKLSITLFICMLIFQAISLYAPGYVVPTALFTGAASSAYTILSLSPIADKLGPIVIAESIIFAMMGSFIVSGVTAVLYGRRSFYKPILIQLAISFAIAAIYLLLF
ncbi:MAG: hypothetical protein QW112_02100, partial [Candidatus Micrarchaeia archaeon]